MIEKGRLRPVRRMAVVGANHAATVINNKAGLQNVAATTAKVPCAMLEVRAVRSTRRLPNPRGSDRPNLAMILLTASPINAVVSLATAFAGVDSTRGTITHQNKTRPDTKVVSTSCGKGR